MSNKPDRSESTCLTYFKSCVSLLTGIAWPTIALSLFIAFRQPVFEILSAVPKKLSQSSKVNFGSLSFEIQEQARDKGDPELAKLITGLSSDAISILLETGNSSWLLAFSNRKPDYYMPSKTTMKAYDELSAKEMLEFSTPPEKFWEFVISLGLKPVIPEADAPATTSPSILYRSFHSISSSDDDKLNLMSFCLTEKGQTARNLLVRAVTNDLK